MGDKAVELPVLRGDPVCPAAFPIAGVSPPMRGVICRVMQDSAESDPGVGMSAGELGVLREADGGVYLNLKSDPSTVANFCHGAALGRATDADAGPRAHFTFCPVWEAWDERRRAHKDGLFDAVDPEPVAMGVSSDQFDDPWAAARQGLEELAPKKAA